MAIEFCPKCESMLITATHNNKQYIICNKCKTQVQRGTKEQIIETEKIPKIKIGKGAATKDLSGYEFKCEKCGNNKCELIDLGMMIGDEDWIYLLQCTKCGHGKRVGDWC